jgi:dTDP-4-dehydrorhamnose reductase
LHDVYFFTKVPFWSDVVTRSQDNLYFWQKYLKTQKQIIMTNILVTGCNGQLGMELQKIAGNFQDYHFIFTDVSELDITKKETVLQFVEQQSIGCIINAAGYTAVDKAETEPEMANLVNGHAVGYLAEAAHNNKGLLVHVSTDYIFSGQHHKPLKESDTPDPISKYAASKLLGEQLVIKQNGKAAIIRTSWLYSSFGHNFVKTMLRLGRERDSLNVVFDQVGTPTYAGDLAEIILKLLPQWSKLTHPEIYHYSNEGVASWYDFAVAAHRIAGVNCNVNPIETKDYPLPAARPFYSLMCKGKIKEQFGITIPHWQQSLEKCIATL